MISALPKLYTVAETPPGSGQVLSYRQQYPRLHIAPVNRVLSWVGLSHFHRRHFEVACIRVEHLNEQLRSNRQVGKLPSSKTAEAARERRRGRSTIERARILVTHCVILRGMPRNRQRRNLYDHAQ